MSATRAKPRKEQHAKASVEADSTRRADGGVAGRRAHRRARQSLPPAPPWKAPRAQTPGRDPAAFRSFWQSEPVIETVQLPVAAPASATKCGPPAQDWGQELENLRYTIDAEEAYAAMRLASSRVEPVRARRSTARKPQSSSTVPQSSLLASGSSSFPAPVETARQSEPVVIVPQSSLLASRSSSPSAVPATRKQPAVAQQSSLCASRSSPTVPQSSLLASRSSPTPV